MTVSQQTPVSNWWGNNSATEFPFNFYIEKESELLVEHTDLNGVKSTLENGVDYSIHEVGNKEGSYITFPLAGSRYKTLAWDTSTDKKELLTLALTLPIEQSAEYEDSGDLSKKNLELSFDYAIRLIQILNRTISRAVKVNEGDETTPDQLIKSLNESKRIAVDAASTATSQAENAQNSANIASEKADIATAKATEVTETYNNAMADIQKDWQDAIDEIEEKQLTAESSITNLQSTAESTISNGIADIKSNKEQSMSAIDENRTTSIEEILANKTSSMNAIDKNRTDTLSEINTMRSEAISNVEAVKTSAEKTINDTKTSAENSITDIKNTAISNVQNQESTTEANIDKKVQEALNKIPDIDDKLNVSKMYKTGETSTDTTGYNQLIEMKHSTFDKSKFTVIGSPTITDDGIASGFSVNNYIKTPNVSRLSKITESLKFTSSFVYNTLSSEQTIWNKNLNFDLRLVNSSIILRTYDGSKSNAFSILQSQHKVANGEQVFCDVVITPNLCRIKINGVEYTKEQVTDFSYLINAADKSFLIGMSNAFNFYFHTSIDLKAFSITVDGKEVFNGNKTGIDTIKADNYEVVGSPVISDDGAASGVSDNDYITIPFNKTATNFKIYYPFKTLSTLPIVSNFILNGTVLFYMSKSGGTMSFGYGSARSGNVFMDNSNWKPDTNYCLEVIRNGENTVTFNFLNLDKNNKILKSYDLDVTNVIPTTDILQLSKMDNMSIDLNSFKIYVDGNLVYQPCLKIPYTLSKTGSKIVDVAYRDRVQDLYEQIGTAPYYTIDETNQNFTLPMGEIYGMINSIKPSSGVELCTVLCMPFGVDESENKYRYLNGQTIVQSQYPAFTAKVKSWQSTRASLFTTEEEWQAIKTASKLGQCGKFVIDDEAGTIRLPAIVNINGLTDLSKAGLIKDESLPAHKHTRGTMEISGALGTVHQFDFYEKGAFYRSWTGKKSGSGGGNGDWSNWEFRASRNWTGSTSAPDNATYQDNAPVQQEAVQYPYVICVNTGVEEAERPINNYQVNNPNSYGDNKYVGNTILNNLSWLRSVGQENPAGVHQDFFNWAVANIGQPFGAGYIKESTATDITEYDLVIDQAKQTFILPTLNGKEVLPQYEIFDTKTFNTPYTATENGFIYGLLNTVTDSTSTYIMVNNRILSADTGAPAYSDSYIPYNYFIKRGDTYKLVSSSNEGNLYYSKAIGNGNLYYYVGDTLQNADLINIARMQEQITDINAQSRGYLVESYTDGTSGYRLYSDGFCEQRGYSNVDSNTLRTITFLKPYKDTNYVVTLGSSNINDNNQNSRIAKVASITTKNMVVTGIFNNALGADFHFYWRTCGYVK